MFIEEATERKANYIQCKQKKINNNIRNVWKWKQRINTENQQNQRPILWEGP